METYTTSQVANIIGVHPNTVRLYEKLGLLPKADRKENNYRVFTNFHIDLFRFARTAFRIEILQNSLRKMIIEAVKVAARSEVDTAKGIINKYIRQILKEKENAEEAVEIAKDLLNGETDMDDLWMKRREVSEYLKISMDKLRNWEMNGLLSVKRIENGYRIYTAEDIKRLKIIRVLRCANYSLESILRMLNALDCNPQTDIRTVLNTPGKTDDIITACDELIVSLMAAEKNARNMLVQLNKIKIKYIKPPL